MKKSAILLIGLIYFVSILLVGIYGLQYKEFNQIVYSTSVEVINTPDKMAYDKSTGEDRKYQPKGWKQNKLNL